MFLEKRISCTFLTPSYVRILGGQTGPFLKKLIVGSEPANNIYLDKVEIYNMYAMSESGFVVSVFKIDKPYSTCPIGKPQFDLDYMLLDEDGNPVSDNEIGEICFRNEYVRGYMNLPEETGKAFVNGIYHSGDLAKKLPDGNLVLLGRSNDMIKINGNRIEPAEIEAAVKNALGIDWVAAKGFENGSQSYLCAYYTADVEIDAEKLRAELLKKLPYYMIPSYYIHIDAIPLKPNGKLDRKALPEPEHQDLSAQYAEPTNDTEKALCNAFGRFRECYFKAGSMNPSTGVVFSYVPQPGAEEQIYQRISDITISMKAITKVSPINYDADAICPRWNRFIDEIMQGNTAVSRYLQKAIGYTMTGDTSLECLFVMYGPTTRNGKTTTIETILRVMGEYGCSAKPDLLAANFRGPSSGGPSEDVARLAGARFVGISEMEQKLTINASLTKQLTGNSSITARFLNQNSFDFRMQAKIFIDTNHLPNVNDQTLFESGRIKIIPFNRHFEDHEQDKTLKFTLADPDNLSGILNWCIEGYRMFKEEGLDEPEDVKNATAQYRQDSDRISQFMAQCLKAEKGSELKACAIYNRYKEWCSENGYKYEGAQNFYKRLCLVYVITKRRPWKQETTGNMNPTNLADDVTWETGEEPEASLVPED